MSKATKTFVRFDSNGNVIPGTMINATKMPVNGYWMEITDNKQCCNPYTEISAEVTTSITGVVATLTKSAGQVITLTTVTDTTTVAETVDLLNTQFSWIGHFYISATGVITLQMKQAIYDTFGGTVTMTIA